MFDMGFFELLLIGTVALLVVGPERLPRLARTAGLWLGRARRVLSEVKGEIDREMDAEDMKKNLGVQNLKELEKDLRRDFTRLQSDLDRDTADSGDTRSSAATPRAPLPSSGGAGTTAAAGASTPAARDAAPSPGSGSQGSASQSSDTAGGGSHRDSAADTPRQQGD